jgi:hypothetical protein
MMGKRLKNEISQGKLSDLYLTLSVCQEHCTKGLRLEMCNFRYTEDLTT